jgi:hypothetical protein
VTLLVQKVKEEKAMERKVVKRREAKAQMCDKKVRE